MRWTSACSIGIPHTSEFHYQQARCRDLNRSGIQLATHICRGAGLTLTYWSKMAERVLKPNYSSVELNKTVWEVPNRYQELQPLGVGAFSSVW